MPRIALLALVLALGACAGAPRYGATSSSRDGVAPTAPEAMAIAVIDERAQPVVKFKSRTFDHGPPEDKALWALIALKPRAAGRTRFYLQWKNVYGAAAWRKFNRAMIGGTEALTLVTLKRDITLCTPRAGCVFEELYNIDLSRGQLERAAAQGVMTLTLGAEDGTTRVSAVPGALITALLARVGPEP